MLGALAWDLDWIHFDPGSEVRDGSGVQWILTEEKGFWGTPQPAVEVSPRLNAHGVYRPSGWKRERTISLTGRCYAPDHTTLREAQANLLGLLSDPSTPALLSCYSEIGVLTSEVYLDDDILVEPLQIISEPGVEFSIQLIAPDPRKYLRESIVMQAALPDTSGVELGLDFFAGPFLAVRQGVEFHSYMTFGYGTGVQSGLVLLENRGTAPATPTYTLHGPLTTPTLTTAEGSMTYNGTLAAGQFVVIDPEAPTVLLSGTESRRHLLSPSQFDAFDVPPAVAGVPGQLTVGLTHTGSDDVGRVEIEFRPAWF